jgi:hypothetical protein
MTTHLPWVLPTLGFVGLIGLQWKNQLDNDIKISRAYQRLDEVKEKHKEDFVAQAVCDVKYQGVIKKLDEISADVKTLIQNGKNKE